MISVTLNRFTFKILCLIVCAMSLTLLPPALADTLTIIGDTTDKPTWRRPDEVGVGLSNTDVPFDVIIFSVNVTGNYDLEITSFGGNNSYLHLYGTQGFDPNDQLAGLIAADDDDAGFPLSRISTEFGDATTLTAGVTYFVVVSGFNSTDFGPYNLEISGPGTINLDLFFPAQNISIGTSPSSMTVADLDNKGPVDVAIALRGANRISGLIYELEQGRFTVQPLLCGDDELCLTGNGPSFITSGSFNKDTLSDLATANEVDGTVTVLRSIANVPLSFEQQNINVVDLVPGCDTCGREDLGPIAAAGPDLLVGVGGGDIGNSSLKQLINNGTGMFNTLAVIDELDSSPTPTALLVANLTPSPSLEFIMTIPRSRSASAKVSIFGGATDTIFVGDKPTAVVAADLVGNNNLDLAVAQVNFNGFENVGTVSVLENTMFNSFLDFDFLGPFSVGSRPSSLAAADFDEDGKIDLAVSDSNENTVRILRKNGVNPNSGDEIFTEVSKEPVGIGPVSVVAADLDGDGDVDLAVANQFSNNVSVLLNQVRNSAIAVSDTSVDFGNVDLQDTSSQLLILTNSGTGILMLGTVSITGSDVAQFSFQNDTCSGATLAPAENCNFDVVFSPTAAGQKEASLSIPSNVPGGPLLVSLRGTGVASDIAIIPLTGSFGNILVEAEVSQIFTVSNTGSANLVLGPIVLTGPEATQFILQNDSCSDRTLVPSDSCPLEVVFTPITTGTKSATLSIPSNATTLPLTVLLSGTGTRSCLPDGDIDGNGTLTPSDARQTLVHFLALAAPPLDTCQQSRADVNQDGRVTPTDALCIFQRLLGQVSCLS